MAAFSISDCWCLVHNHAKELYPESSKGELNREIAKAINISRTVWQEELAQLSDQPCEIRLISRLTRNRNPLLYAANAQILFAFAAIGEDGLGTVRTWVRPLLSASCRAKPCLESERHPNYRKIHKVTGRLRGRYAQRRQSVDNAAAAALAFKEFISRGYSRASARACVAKRLNLTTRQIGRLIDKNGHPLKRLDRTAIRV